MSRRLLGAPELSLLALGIALQVSFWAYTGSTLEDALITFRYALNFARGDGLVFNVGERVLGTTTPLFALFLGGVGALLGEGAIGGAAKTSAIAASAGTAILTLALLRRLEAPRWASLCGLGLFYLMPSLLTTTLGGMETPLVVFWMALALHALGRGDLRLLGVACALLVWTRPDGVIWSACVALPLAMTDRRALLRAALWGAAVLLPWLAFSTLYYGSPLPHSIVAKSTIEYGVPAGTLISLGRVLVHTRWMLEGAGLPLAGPGSLPSLAAWFLLLGMGLRHAWLRRAQWPLLLPVAVFPALLGLAYHVGRAPHFTWYPAPATWPCVLLAALGLAELRRTLLLAARRRGASEQPARLAPGGIGLAVLLALLLSDTAAFRTARAEQRNEEGLSRAVGEWLKRATPPDAAVAAEAMGYQGYYAERRMIDLAGLVSPEVVAIRGASQSNAEAFYEILTRLEPDYLVLRSFEVDANRHFHGGPLFENEVQRRFFHTHFVEELRISAPVPEAWQGGTAHVTIFARRGARG